MLVPVERLFVSLVVQLCVLLVLWVSLFVCDIVVLMTFRKFSHERGACVSFSRIVDGVLCDQSVLPHAVSMGCCPTVALYERVLASI